MSLSPHVLYNSNYHVLQAAATHHMLLAIARSGLERFLVHLTFTILHQDRT